MANIREDSPAVDYAPPSIVEWFEFTVDQLKATVNLFSAEIQAVLNEYVKKNARDLIREDYKSAKISQQGLTELQERVNNLIHSLRKRSAEAEGELYARFPLIQSGNEEIGNVGLMSTNNEQKLQNSESSVREAQESAGSSERTSIITSPNLSDSYLSSTPNDDNEKTEVIIFGRTDVSGRNLKSALEVETHSMTGSEEDISSETIGVSQSEEFKQLTILERIDNLIPSLRKLTISGEAEPEFCIRSPLIQCKNEEIGEVGMISIDEKFENSESSAFEVVEGSGSSEWESIKTSFNASDLSSDDNNDKKEVTVYTRTDVSGRNHESTVAVETHSMTGSEEDVPSESIGFSEESKPKNVNFMDASVSDAETFSDSDVDIPDKLLSNNTIDLSLPTGKSRKAGKQLEPEDEVTKAVRRVCAFNPYLKERDNTNYSHSKSITITPKTTKEKNKVDDCEGRYFYDNSTSDDNSENQPLLRSPIPAQDGIPKDDWLDSEDEDLGGALSSFFEENNTRKSILKEANKLKTEFSSDDEQKNKKQSGGSYYYTPGVCRFSKKFTSDLTDSDSDDCQTEIEVGGNKKKSILSNSDDDVSDNENSETSDDKCSTVASNNTDFAGKTALCTSTGSDSDDKKKNETRKRVKILSGYASFKKKQRNIVKQDEQTANGNVSDVKKVSQDKGRKNIRKVWNKKALLKETRLAEMEEEKRKKRIADRQARFNKIFEASETPVMNSLVLDIDEKTKEVLVSVDPNIVKILKPHQVDGVRFMWNACFETVEQYKEPDNDGGGCILAHCMGLGKTLQIVALIHTVMTSKHIGLKSALVICPLNTVGNWYNELKIRLKDVNAKPKIHKLYNRKNNEARVQALKVWQRSGGIGIINYESFRSLVIGNRLKEKTKAMISTALLSPGPEIVVCDEGHIFKNASSKMAFTVNQIKTKRRIVLTGTPLQNSLIEFHCMMEFVKPKLLGSKKEFSNRFVNPITNGQHKDSTAKDVSFMKKRAHVLHKLLDGCVQRRDYTVLVPYLPPKYEYVVSINMTEIQKKLYTHYLKSIKQDASVKELIKGGQLLKHVANLSKVWCHPYTLEMKLAKYHANSSELEDSLKSFNDNISDVSGSVRSQSKIKTSVNFDNTMKAVPSELSSQAIRDGEDWWSKFFKSKGTMKLMEHSSKLVILFEILKACEGRGDKVLVFSPNLHSLDIIELYLKEKDEVEKLRNVRDNFPRRNGYRWRKNIEYFRIDGSTKPEDRQKNCDIFNDAGTTRAKLFLISTKAGGLGINLIGANRVVIFDASWNPSHDMQSIFRVFRFGQTKPCYIYRLLAKGTMEEKIYNRQVVKLSLSGRVVDEHQIERHFTFEDIAGMYTFDPSEKSDRNLPPVPQDRLLADLLISQKDKIATYLEHDSLLQNQVDEGLTEEERKIAWNEYQYENLLKERLQDMSSSDSD